MLEVGLDSYVTLQEAENILESVCTSNDSAYIKWNELSDSDKEVLLRNSCRDINSLKFTGKRQNLGQKLEFPRVNQLPCGIGYSLYISQFTDNVLAGAGSSNNGLAEVRQAQCINAVYAAMYSDLTDQTIGMNIQGLTSKKAGPIAETYNRNNRSSEDALMGIYTKKVYSILRCWINDSRVSY